VRPLNLHDHPRYMKLRSLTRQTDTGAAIEPLLAGLRPPQSGISAISLPPMIQTRTRIDYPRFASSLGLGDIGSAFFGTPFSIACFSKERAAVVEPLKLGWNTA